MVPSSPTPGGNVSDNLWYRHPSHPLRSSRKPQGTQEERDVDRVESRNLVSQRCWLLSLHTSRSYDEQHLVWHEVPSGGHEYLFRGHGSVGRVVHSQR